MILLGAASEPSRNKSALTMANRQKLSALLTDNYSASIASFRTNTRVKIDGRGTRWYRLKRQSRWNENFWPVSSSRVPKLLFNYKIKTLRLRGSWLPYRISQKFKSMRLKNYSKRSEQLLPRKKLICFRAFKLWHSVRNHYLSNAKLPMRRRWRHWVSLLRTMKKLRKRTIF